MASYSNTSREAILPAVAVPLYVDINGEPVAFWGAYSVTLEIPFGFSDFQFKEYSFIEMLPDAPTDLCYSIYDPLEGSITINEISVPTIVPIYSSSGLDEGPSLKCSAVLTHSPIRPEVFSLEEGSFLCELL